MSKFGLLIPSLSASLGLSSALAAPEDTGRDELAVATAWGRALPQPGQFPPPGPIIDRLREFGPIIDPRQIEFDDRRSLEFFPEPEFDAIAIAMGAAGTLRVTGTVVRLAGCWSLFADGRERGALDLAELAEEFQQVGLRVNATLTLPESRQGGCGSALTIAAIETIEAIETTTATTPPPPPLAEIRDRLAAALDALDIAGTLALAGSYIEVTGIDLVEAESLRDALAGRFAMLALHYDQSSGAAGSAGAADTPDAASSPAAISVWPLAGGAETP